MFKQNRIKELRKKKGVKAVEVAKAVGVSQSMLTNYEKGVVTPRDCGVWERLANYFDVTVGYLLGFEKQSVEMVFESYPTPRHELKIEVEYFKLVLNGIKKFEIRKNDRGFRVGDLLILKEYDTGIYTGREINVWVTYITDYKQQPDYVVLGIDFLRMRPNYN